jgi:hypothetical protein
MSIELNPLKLSIEELSIKNHKNGQQLQLTKDIGNGVSVDCFARFISNATHLICLFPSAQQANSERLNPVFHRWTWAYQIGNTHTISLSDPSLYESTLHANWFQSKSGQDYFQLTAEFIKNLAENLDIKTDKILLYGSSMGGFSALMAGAHIPESLVIAEVPQIDLRRYYISSSLRQIEEAHFNNIPIEDYYRAKKSQINVLDRFVEQKCAPSIQIITNDADPACSEHLSFIADIKKIRSSLKVVGDISVTCKAAPTGHKPLPTPIAINIIKSALMQGWSNHAQPHPNQVIETATDIHSNHTKKDYKEILNAGISAATKIKFTRTPEDAINYKEAKDLLYQAAEINNKADWPLLKICSTVKLWNNSFNTELLTAATEAFKRKESLEAFIYLCRGIISNKAPDEAIRQINEFQSKCTDQQTANVANIFKGIIKYDAGDFDGYEHEIANFLKTKDANFNPYIAIPVSTVLTNTKPIETYEPNYLPTILGKSITSNACPTQNKKYIISTSCDLNYLRTYGEFIVRSFSLSCAHEAHLHILITNGEISEIDQLLSNWGAKSTSASVAGIDCGENEAPIASLLRFTALHGLLKTQGLPVFVMDLDSLIFKPMSPIVENNKSADVCSRILKGGVAPWEKYTGGFALFYPTQSGLAIAQSIARAAAALTTKSARQWWIDQNCFEAGIRVAYKRNQNPRIVDFSSIRNDFCTMPVGNKEAKLFTLKNALNSLLN